jgi:flagellar protein FlgJ
MTSPTATTKDLSSKFALDVRDMGSLKQSARAGSPGRAEDRRHAVRSHVRQHDVEEHARSHAAGRHDGQPAEQDFQTMLDQQTSQNIAKKGIGLADMLVRQLSAKPMRPRWPSAASRAAPAAPTPAASAAWPA